MLHKNATPAERHAPWSWEFADAAARLLAVDFVEQDVGKLALDKDTKQAWILSSTAPTWVPIGTTELEAHETAADPHPQYAKADDLRFSDPRTPTAHSHSFSDVTGLASRLVPEGGEEGDVLTRTAEGFAWAPPPAGGSQTTTVALSGTLSLDTGASTVLTITNYDSSASYSASATGGTATIDADEVTYTAGGTAGSFTLTVTVNGNPVDFQVTVNAVVVGDSYIATPAPTPANFGDPFEGGFYAGMYWDQIAQSSSSKTLATGTQTFTVPDMTGAPIVYGGQTLEVRSRANPANKFIGTVTGATGTTLTLNVSSIGGSGTFSDWSVMSRFRSIDAPKASGEHAGIALKNANTALPSGCQTLVDGWAATEAMRLAGNSTEYPAAHWARGLNIGGYTDWHIPARDVLELRWRNLKPTTTANYTTANRDTGQSFDYKINGAYGDTANTHGLNNNSSPTGAAYTASVPGQTAATAFRTGGAEAYEFGSAYYWSSTEYSAANAWDQYWNSSYPGHQNYNYITNTHRVRAVRRSII